MVVPLGWKLRIHRALDRPLFDLSAYAPFRPGGCADIEPRIEVAVAARPGDTRRRQLRLVTPNPCSDDGGLVEDMGRLAASDCWEMMTIIDRPPEGLGAVSDLAQPDDKTEHSAAPRSSERTILFATSNLIVPRRRFFEACGAELARLRPDLGLRGNFGAADDPAAAEGIAGAVFIAPDRQHRAQALKMVRRGLPVVYWHETAFSRVWGAAPGGDVSTQRARTLVLILDRIFPT